MECTITKLDKNVQNEKSKIMHFIQRLDVVKKKNWDHPV